MRFVKLLLLLFLVAATVTIAARIQLSKIIIGEILHRAGGDNVVLRISEIGLQRFKVDLLSCRFTGNSGPITIKLQNLSIHYQPGELIQGNLREAVINSLEVTLPSGKKESSTAFEPRNLHQFMNSRWRETIPFQSLTIHKIMVHGKSATLLENKKLNFSMQAEQGVIKAALTLNDQGNAPISLIAVSQDANHLALSLGTEGHAPQKGLQLDLQATTDQRVAVQFKLQLEQLGSIAKVVDLALPMVQGMVDGEISMDFAGNGAELAADISTADLSLASFSCKSAALHLERGQLHPGEFLLGHGSYVNLKTASFASGKLDNFRLDLSGTVKLDRQNRQFISAPDSLTTFTGLKLGNLNLAQGSLIPAMTVSHSRLQTTINLLPDFTLSALNIAARDVHIHEISLSPVQTTRLTAAAGESSWSLEPGLWHIQSLKLTKSDLHIETAPVSCLVQQLEGKGNQFNFKGKVQTDNILMSSKALQSNFNDFSLEMIAGNSQLAGKALLRPAGVPGEIQVVFNHDLNKGNGRAEIRTLKPLDFSGENITLSDLLINLPLPFDLNQGQLHFSSIADWAKGKAPSLGTRLHLVNGAGMVKHLVFTGLTTVQDLDLLPNLRSRTEGTLTIDSLQGGIEAHTITAQTFVNPSPHGKLPLLRISNLSAHLFGGEISTDDLLYDLNQPASDFTVRLHGINLAEIMSTQPVKGLQLSGTIDGILPVTIKAKDISVSSGKIYNQSSGGVIRYTPQVESALKQSALTGYALTALEEFHYDTLRASTTYSPDGLLEVNIQLQGKSPRLDTNRPVHLNVNTEQNILSLLQSLRYSKNLTDELGSKIQQHVKP